MRVTILQGHPNSESYCAALALAYQKGLENGGHECRVISLPELEFDPILRTSYREMNKLEPDLLSAQEAISWCEHFVIAYPIWWGQVPALLKGFFDRTLLPGWAFKYHKNDPFWDRLLAGRSARMIVTSDAPSFYNFIVYRNAPVNVVKRTTLDFCGFKPIRVTTVGRVKKLSSEKRQKILQKMEKLGFRAR